MKGLIIGIWLIVILVNGGEKSTNIPSNTDMYIKNYDYQMFYGTWQITEVVSQHETFGGDEGYEELIGEYVTYTYDYYECCGTVINNPDYWITVRPIEQNTYNEFFSEQIGIEKLLPGINLCTIVEIVDKPVRDGVIEREYCGNIFFIKDDNTLYCYDYNCIYELTRVEYQDNYEDVDVMWLNPKW